jgi:DNA-directed RNA polymerase subunit RPC12/RpoP
MSYVCPRCGTELDRQRRSLPGRLLFTRVLACGGCRHVVREWRVPFSTSINFLVSRHTRCIECGNSRVRRQAHKDLIDPMSRHPLSMVQLLALAPIYYCARCRLQYRDWRRLHPVVAQEPAKPTGDSGQQHQSPASAAAVR